MQDWELLDTLLLDGQVVGLLGSWIQDVQERELQVQNLDEQEMGLLDILDLLHLDELDWVLKYMQD